jgi:hypothetical protein
MSWLVSRRSGDDRRGDWAGSAGTSPRPAAAPRHEVRGEQRGEVGDGVVVPDRDLGRRGERKGRAEGGGAVAGNNLGRRGRERKGRRRLR